MEDAVLLDTNAFINALARRDPPELTDLALDVGLTVVTQDGDFDLFLQLEPGLRVVFYD